MAATTPRRNRDGCSCVNEWVTPRRHELTVDQIALTLPADDAFQRVAHLVLGGLASRQELTVDTLDDLTLALDAVFDRYGDLEDTVTVRVTVGEDELATEIGAFHNADIAHELSHPSEDALDLRRILTAVFDDVSVAEREGAEWVVLRKELGHGERTR
jgi:hypothetical protein